MIKKRLLLILTPTLAFSAESNSPLTWKNQGPVKSLTAEFLEPEDEARQVQYSYTSFNSPDPFVPPMLQDFYQGSADAISNLQKISPNSLQIIGIWQLKTLERKALITTPDGEAFIISVNDPVGPSGGRVYEITSNQVIIRTVTLSPDGSSRFSDYTINMSLKTNG